MDGKLDTHTRVLVWGRQLEWSRPSSEYTQGQLLSMIAKDPAEFRMAPREMWETYAAASAAITALPFPEIGLT